MRLLDFLIHEKVSKKELKDIFNNDNILVGAEFEYIDNDMQEIASGDRDKQQLYNDAMSDYGQWEREMEEWRDEYHKIEKDKESYHFTIDDNGIGMTKNIIINYIYLIFKEE